MAGLVASALALGGISGCASKNAEASTSAEAGGLSLAERVQRAEFAAMEAQRTAQEAQRIAEEARTKADQASQNAQASDEKIGRAYERAQQK